MSTRDQSERISNAIRVFLTTLLISLPAAAAVKITVSEVQQPGGVVYTYSVANSNDNDRVVAVRIGFDYLHGVAELRTPPAGSTPDNDLPSGSVSSPRGWSPMIVATEESEVFDLEWTSDSSGAFDISPHVTLTGFAVRTPSTTPEYASADFDVILGSGAHVYGRVEPDKGKRRIAGHADR
jgi:hypothetical protein